MDSITDEARKEYLKNGAICPKCGSDNNIHVYGDNEYSYTTVWRTVKCTCGLHMIETYILADIEEIESDEFE